MGAVAGVAFGVGFGWATGRAFLRTDGGPVSYPVLQITGYIAVAAVAALLASVLPARRAARLTVIDGLAAELSRLAPNARPASRGQAGPRGQVAQRGGGRLVGGQERLQLQLRHRDVHRGGEAGDGGHEP
jgi:hypothetical protein